MESDTISGMAFVISVVVAVATLWQAMKTSEALDQQKSVTRVDTILHFTESYFRLKGESASQNWEDENWAEKYWGLYSAEFYFYHRRVLPELMFALWMTGVADLYKEKPIALQSHQKFLNRYRTLYPEMNEFFTKLYELSTIESHDECHGAVGKFVKDWIMENGVHDIS